MKSIIDYFRRTKRIEGAIDEDWLQHRVQFERLGSHYDVTT